MIQTIIIFYKLLKESSLLQKIVLYIGILCLIIFITQITKTQFENYFGINFIIAYIYSIIAFMILYYVLKNIPVIEYYTNFLSDFLFNENNML